MAPREEQVLLARKWPAFSSSRPAVSGASTEWVTLHEWLLRLYLIWVLKVERTNGCSPSSVPLSELCTCGVCEFDIPSSRPQLLCDFLSLWRHVHIRSLATCKSN